MFYSYEWNNDTNEWAIDLGKSTGMIQKIAGGELCKDNKGVFTPIAFYDKVLEKKVH